MGIPMVSASEGNRNNASDVLQALAVKGLEGDRMNFLDV